MDPREHKAVSPKAESGVSFPDSAALNPIGATPQHEIGRDSIKKSISSSVLTKTRAE